jgi:hypothetical protein
MDTSINIVLILEYLQLYVFILDILRNFSCYMKGAT